MTIPTILGTLRVVFDYSAQGASMDILLLSLENDPTLPEVRFYTHQMLSKRFWCRYGTFWSIFVFVLKLQWESVTETKK